MSDKFNPTDAQLEAINEIDKNLQIVACAGSGKTEVISRRIANILKSKHDIKPENVVAFTFTEKAAESLKNRIVKVLDVTEDSLQDMYIGTIHGFCWHLLKKYTEKFSEFKILDSVKSHLFVERYSKECGMETLGMEVYSRNINLFLQCIDKMIDDYDNFGQWSENNQTAFEQYISCLYEHKYIDFSLMIFETLKQIDENSVVSDYLRNIKYLIVDEYQDVNDLQENLITSIAKQGANVCVVGDDDQTIYQFRGSNANNMIDFSKRYNDVHQVKLEENFRCTKKDC